MEIPCIVHFAGNERELKKVEQFFSSIPSILTTTVISKRYTASSEWPAVFQPKIRCKTFAIGGKSAKTVKVFHRKKLHYTVLTFTMQVG